MRIEVKDAVESSDRELLEEFIRSRDKDVFRVLVERHHSMVLGVSRRVTGCVHTAEDVLQATFLVLSKDAHRIRKRESLTSWLYGVAYRISIRAAKQRAKIPTSTLEDEVMVEASPLERLTKQSEETTVLEELHRLPQNMRTPMVMRYIGGKSNAQIADELRLSEAAVEGRLKRGRNQLRMRLTRTGVAFGTATLLLNSLGQESQASEASSLIAQTVEACCHPDPGVGTHASDDVKYLVNEEIKNMATFKLTTAHWAFATLGIVAAGWAVAGDGGAPQGSSQASTGDNVLVVQETASVAAGEIPVSLTSNAGPTWDLTGTQAPSPDQSNQERLRRLGVYSVDERSEQSIKILEALQSQTDFEFSDALAVEVLDYIKAVHSIQIVIDNVALDNESISLNDAPITINLKNLQLKNALTLMLDELQLAFVQRNEVLMITTKVVADSTLFSRAYRPEADWEFGTEEIIEAITSTIEPTSWQEVGGPGSIATIGGGIVITSTQAVHEKIDNLFAQLSRLNLNLSKGKNY